RPGPARAGVVGGARVAAAPVPGETTGAALVQHVRLRTDPRAEIDQVDRLFVGAVSDEVGAADGVEAHLEGPAVAGRGRGVVVYAATEPAVLVSRPLVERPRLHTDAVWGLTRLVRGVPQVDHLPGLVSETQRAGRNVDGVVGADPEHDLLVYTD